MIVLIALLVVMFGILGFRIYRTIQYYNEAHNSSDPKEKSIAEIACLYQLKVAYVLS